MKPVRMNHPVPTADSWKGAIKMEKRWWQEEIVYQIYPKSFYDSNNDGIGDLKGITQKLPYLQELGVTMLWICPFYRSPMNDNGYDISDYQSIAPEFGSMEDLDELIAQARQRGIRIVIDLVINHTSDEHEWFQKALADPDSPYRDYYIFRPGKTPPNNWRSCFGGSCWEPVPGREEYYFHVFAKKQPDLNWESPALRQNLYEMVYWWLDIGFAGFRLDAFTYIKQDLTWHDGEPDGADGLSICSCGALNQPGIDTFLHELRENTFDRHQCFTVAEAPGVPYDHLDAFIGPDGHFSMIFDFSYADLDIGSGGEWFRPVPWTIPKLNRQIMTCQMAVQKCGWAANFLENHDQPRSTTKYLKDAQHNPDAVKTLAAMYFFLRGTPFIYQGQELGMVNCERQGIGEFDDLSTIDQYNRSIQEGFSEAGALEMANRRSRDNARTPFPWNGEQYGGFSQAKPWLGMTEEYPAVNVQAQQHDPNSVWHFFKKMIAFRQSGPHRNCLIYGNIEPLYAGETVIAYRRLNEEDRLYCWFNLGSEPVSEPLPQADMDPVWHTQNAVRMENGMLILAPYQSVILRER